MSENCIMTLADFTINEMTPEAANAIELHNNIVASMQTAANAMVTLCENLKRMRDTQSYKALGFERFEDYTERACGIKKRQAYNYIQTYERLGSTVLQANAQLGITKLQLLTEVTAVDRAEFIEQNDLASVSVAEMKELVAKTKDQAQQIDLLQSTAQENHEKIIQLQQENNELRSRPTEVAVQQPTEEEIAAAAAERTQELEEKHAAELKELEKSAKAKVKEAKEKARQKAAAEKEKEIAEAKAKAKAEAEQEYKDKLAVLGAEKAEAEEKARALASKLDKNADADLVKASTYFTEAQEHFNKFKAAVEKISEADSEKAQKLKAVAQSFLTQYIENL
ncbi:MAG: hypothetical protein UIH27_11060 [Ruminococcus sp.]|nr:hypothetical protein [Ruminococcus sp.]